jgi:hypothetical protein
MAGQILLSPDVITRMINDPKIVGEFRFLANYGKPGVAGCGSCGNQRQSGVNWHAIKRSIVAMPGARQQRLKTLLGVASIKVFYRNTRGKMLEETL